MARKIMTKKARLDARANKYAAAHNRDGEQHYSALTEAYKTGYRNGSQKRTKLLYQYFIMLRRCINEYGEALVTKSWAGSKSPGEWVEIANKFTDAQVRLAKHLEAMEKLT